MVEQYHAISKRKKDVLTRENGTVQYHHLNHLHHHFRCTHQNICKIVSAVSIPMFLWLAIC